MTEFPDASIIYLSNGVIFFLSILFSYKVVSCGRDWKRKRTKQLMDEQVLGMKEFPKDSQGVTRQLLENQDLAIFTFAFHCLFPLLSWYFPFDFLFILGILVLNFLGLNIIILSSSIGWKQTQESHAFIFHSLSVTSLF